VHSGVPGRGRPAGRATRRRRAADAFAAATHAAHSLPAASLLDRSFKSPTITFCKYFFNALRSVYSKNLDFLYFIEIAFEFCYLHQLSYAKVIDEKNSSLLQKMYFLPANFCQSIVKEIFTKHVCICALL